MPSYKLVQGSERCLQYNVEKTEEIYWKNRYRGLLSSVDWLLYPAQSLQKFQSYFSMN